MSFMREDIRKRMRRTSFSSQSKDSEEVETSTMESTHTKEGETEMVSINNLEGDQPANIAKVGSFLRYICDGVLGHAKAVVENSSLPSFFLLFTFYPLLLLQKHVILV
jgi:hypothetical protein